MGGMVCQVCHDSPCTCTFMASAVAGNFDDLDEGFCDAVEEWHKGGTNVELYEFLGMTDDEYKRVVGKPGSLEQVVRDRVAAKPDLFARSPAAKPRVLAPCARPGTPPDDWWTAQHVSCTGSQHLHDPVLGVIEIMCSCAECHCNKKSEPEVAS